MAGLEGRILVVEGDEALAEIMGELLYREGYAIHVVRAIGEAVARLRVERIGGVILDLDTVPLRSNDGAVIMLGTWLRTTGVKVPFILVSVRTPALAYPVLPPPLRQYANQWLAWLHKPFRNIEFRNVVRRTFVGRQEDDLDH
jgi:DNA-binding NtrC family response regulator